MKDGRFGVGIIGIEPGRSWAAVAHVPALRSLGNFELVAVCTTNAQSAERAAKALNVPRWYADPLSLASDPDVDLIVIAVKVTHHRELVEAVLNAKKMIYCEWPLGNGLAESIAIASAARQAGVRTVVGLQARVSPTLCFLRDLLRDGYVGEVLSTSMIGSGSAWGAKAPRSSAYLADKANGATVLTIPFGHAIDALCHCLGEFDNLTATMTTRRREVTILESGERLPVTSEDQVILGGLLKSGAAVSIHYRGGISRGVNFLWEINGTDGDLQITATGGGVQIVELKLHGGNHADKGLHVIDIPASYDDRLPLANGPGRNVAALYAQLAADISEGTRICPDFDDAVARHVLLQKIDDVAYGNVARL